MGCVTSLESKNQVLKDQVAAIKREIAQIEEEIRKLQNTIDFIGDKDDEEPNKFLLETKNKNLKAQSKELQQLREQRALIESGYESALILNDKLVAHFKLPKGSLGVNSLEDKLWRPLTELVHKFKEFDMNGNGFVDRNEFYKLCTAIECELKIVRLFSDQNQHSASSAQGNNKNGMINSRKYWCAAANDQNQWYQIDAVRTIAIAGLVIQGRPDHNHWIKNFRISHSRNGVDWTKIDELFNGNQDRESHRRVLFSDPVSCRFVRIHPVSWKGLISMRCDLLWIEKYDDKEQKEREARKSDFTFGEQDRLFDLFDLKQTGGISVDEFMAVLDRETIRTPDVHPYRIIKQTMNHLLHGNAEVKPQYSIKRLATFTEGVKDALDDKVICCVCYYEPGIYGFTDECKHRVCGECLKDSLKYILNEGKFPAYCIGCKAEESMAKNTQLDLDILIKGPMLRFWIEEGLIDLELAMRFDLQQNKALRKYSSKMLRESTTIRKCPDCHLIVLKNHNGIFECKECGYTELY